MRHPRAEAPSKKVYTIPAGVAFLDAIARRVLDEAGSDPLALCRVTILLPTRRACRALQESFLRLSRRDALLLPLMRPLGDLDDEGPEAANWPEGAHELPPAIGPLRRRLLLTRLILRWAKARGQDHLSADQAARLSGELARLLDQVETERLSFDGLSGLVPDDYATHWQITLDFLELVTEHWPAILDELGLMDPALRRNRALEALAVAWRRQPPDEPVIAAGSTGSIPATADLLASVAELPRGAVVLPGLDGTLAQAEWQALEPSHPQYGLKKLLERLGVERGDVQAWPTGAVTPSMVAPSTVAPSTAAPPTAARARVLSLALSPAGAPADWPAEISALDAALQGVERVDCPGLREEAGVIALRMREALETPGKRAALVTPDRELARRVAAELRRYAIEIDDSGGIPLADSPPGLFLRLTAELAQRALEPIALLAALKHPLAAGGLSSGAFKDRVRRLERAALRGPRPAPGFQGLRRVLDESEEGRALRPWLEALERQARPFLELIGRASVPLGRLIEGHLAFAEAWGASEAEPGEARLWAGEAGEAAAAFMAEFLDGAGAMEAIEGPSYPALLESLMAGPSVRPRYGRHDRLFIWGPLEARLQQTDLMILGGLNEASWPPEPEADPWMSRPMRAAFGLAALERRIGLSAHDFAQCFAAPEVMLSRAVKVAGTPTVPSRWLIRLETLLTALGRRGALERAAPLRLAWQKRLDAPERFERIEPPAPAPALAARPRRLSVTQVETWMRDPYAVYARHVLKLKPLDPIGAEPGAAERGIFIHEALDDFISGNRGELPPDALARLIACGEKAFGAALARPGVWVFWWPRFLRIARWFVDTERARRAAAFETLGTEVRGKMTVTGPAGLFTLTAKADRIDRDGAGGLVIIDYKTGTLPKPDHIQQGLSPQLALEAAIAEAGGFAAVPPAGVTELAYWRLGGGDPAGETKPVAGDPRALIGEAEEGLKRLVAAFDDPATAYAVRPRPEAPPAGGDYDHLARLKEWSAVEEGVLS